MRNPKTGQRLKADLDSLGLYQVLATNLLALYSFGITSFLDLVLKVLPSLNLLMTSGMLNLYFRPSQCAMS